MTTSLRDYSVRSQRFSDLWKEHEETSGGIDAAAYYEKFKKQISDEALVLTRSLDLTRDMAIEFIGDFFGEISMRRRPDFDDIEEAIEGIRSSLPEKMGALRYLPRGFIEDNAPGHINTRRVGSCIGKGVSGLEVITLHMNCFWEQYDNVFQQALRDFDYGCYVSGFAQIARLVAIIETELVVATIAGRVEKEAMDEETMRKEEEKKQLIKRHGQADMKPKGQSAKKKKPPQRPVKKRADTAGPAKKTTTKTQPTKKPTADKSGKNSPPKSGGGT